DSMARTPAPQPCNKLALRRPLRRVNKASNQRRNRPLYVATLWRITLDSVQRTAGTPIDRQIAVADFDAPAQDGCHGLPHRADLRHAPERGEALFRRQL